MEIEELCKKIKLIFSLHKKVARLSCHLLIETHIELLSRWYIVYISLHYLHTAGKRSFKIQKSSK